MRIMALVTIIPARFQPVLKLLPVRRSVALSVIIIIVLVMSPLLPADSSPVAASRTTLVLSTVNAAPLSTPDRRGIGDRLMQEAFRRIGVRIEIKHLPMERALFDANEGVDDGNYVRTDELGDQYPNLIAVPEPVIQAEFVVFSKMASLQVSGWIDLSPYRVGIIRGCKISEKHLARAKAVARVRDLRLLMMLLVENKVDAVVYDRIHGMVFLDTIKQYGIHIARRPLAKKNMYLYLHKKHGDLAPRLAEAIRSMKHDGTYQSIKNDVMKLYPI